MSVIMPPKVDCQNGVLRCEGAWITRQIKALPQFLPASVMQECLIVGEGLTAFDTAGALLLNQYLQQLTARKIPYHLEGFQQAWLDLLKCVETDALELPPSTQQGLTGLALLGKEIILKSVDFFNFFNFIGQMVSTLLHTLKQPRRFHLNTIINTADQAGCKALPIVGLLCFLIGVVLAYQLGIQLKTYGANILIVFLTGLAILREFGPLIAAIIMAGRTSSAFTAEIGSMKVNQEIDAMMSMGLSPMEFLVIPKMIAMLLVFPLLIFWADLFGVLGSMFMAKLNLGVGFGTFIREFENTVDVKQLLIGLSKAPVFALIIVLVGCYQGFQVEYSADSIGKKTTKSVVQAIFLIIIADALFSILYGHVGV